MASVIPSAQVPDPRSYSMNDPMNVVPIPWLLSGSGNDSSLKGDKGDPGKVLPHGISYHTDVSVPSVAGTGGDFLSANLDINNNITYRTFSNNIFTAGAYTPKDSDLASRNLNVVLGFNAGIKPLAKTIGIGKNQLGLGMHPTNSSWSVHIGDSGENVFAEGETIRIGKNFGITASNSISAVPDALGLRLGARSIRIGSIDDTPVVGEARPPLTAILPSPFGSSTIYIGSNVGFNPNGQLSIAIGKLSLAGVDNLAHLLSTATQLIGMPPIRAIAIGQKASSTGVISEDTISIGYQAQVGETQQVNSTLSGTRGGRCANSNNIAIGALAIGVGAGANNIAIGAEAGFGFKLQSSTGINTELVGTGSVLLGYRAGASGCGNYNVCIGSGAGKVLTLPNSILIGYRTCHSRGVPVAGSVVLGSKNEIVDIGTASRTARPVTCIGTGNFVRSGHDVIIGNNIETITDDHDRVMIIGDAVPPVAVTMPGKTKSCQISPIRRYPQGLAINRTRAAPANLPTAYHAMVYNIKTKVVSYM